MKFGSLINPDKKIVFDFNGQKITALSGDTVATALWRAGIRTMSRSFKYHRRRSILSLSAADANTLMDIDGAPNVCAAVTPATANMIVRARHCGGNIENDYWAFMRYLSPFLPPGFYYKAFYKPQGIWTQWEKLIRRFAGLGIVNPAATPAEVPIINDFCNIAIIGGGVAGMAAATAAAKTGKTVCLLDRNPILGGALNWRGGDSDLPADVAAAANIRQLLSCEVSGVFADNLIIARTPHHSLRLRAAHIIYATGTRETPVVFANNDLPGVMLISAALRLACLYDLACGRRAAVLISSAADVDSVRLLQNYGIDIVAVFNLGDANTEWANTLSADGITVYQQISELAALGQKAVHGIHAIADGAQVDITCDCVLMNGGEIPVAELPAAAGIAFDYDATCQKPTATDNALVGAVHNRGGMVAAQQDGVAAANNSARPPANGESLSQNVFFAAASDMAFVDFEEDLQLKDLDDAIAEGFDDIQLLKRYTTAGMGPAQGKLTNVLVARHLARRRQCDTAECGQITARPPASAETLAELAAAPTPTKLSVLHREHLNLSASLMTAGAWLRPAHYGNIESEVLAVRNHAGIIDISTLGKIKISGIDAAEFLHRFYTGNFINQKHGTVRYALLLDETGVIVDDGVVARLTDGSFWVTATTGHADAVYRQMLLWCARWQLRADIINMTSAFAAISIAGPNAMSLLATTLKTLKVKTDLSYMRATEFFIGGDWALMMRVGFVGEKGCEIHLPAGRAAVLWNALCADATPFGVEAQRLLRLEKGHLIVGQDTDGLTTPLEANMEWALGRNKSFYIGQRALDIHRRRGITRQLRGFVLNAHRYRIDESDLVLNGNGDAVGHVTSVAYSPTLHRIIGLAYAPVPQTNEQLRLRTANGETIEAKIVPPPFYDRQGERQQ